MQRRQLLAGLPVAAASVRPSHGGPPPLQPFSFLFITDTHIQPELDAARGCARAFAQARREAVDFAIQGGDHVFDALGVGLPRAAGLADLYARTAQDLGLTVHHTIGNHDCFGVLTQSGASPTDPLYGKKFFEDRWGRLYYAFDHKGVHVVVLDSIGITADRSYEGRIDAAQCAWLAADLAALPPETPIVVVSHIPLATGFPAYLADQSRLGDRRRITVGNAAQVIGLFAGRRVLGVLQGHTHINETVWWQGVPFITCGAVCGNWWHGTRLGVPEGYTVVSVGPHGLSTRYVTYGFRSIDPRPD